MSSREVIALLVVVCVATGGAFAAEKTVTIFHAGSLAVPFEKLEESFEKSHPGVDVRRQAFGSAMAIRQVTELGKKAEVVASADYRLIDRMMVMSTPKWAEWNRMFARNSIVIATSAEAPEITTDNWTDVIRDKNVKVAFSNPNHDPCGYRALMTVYLAEAALGAENVFGEVILGNTNITVAPGGETTVLCVPESLEVGGNLVVRPKETDLLPLLEVGAVDCLFIYRSVAVQHGLKFVPLQPEVNLSDAALEDVYGKVTVRLGGSGGVEVKAGAIVYGVTVPAEAPEGKLAAEFIQLILSPEGQRIFSECGQEPIVPAVFSEASAKP